MKIWREIVLGNCEMSLRDLFAFFKSVFLGEEKSGRNERGGGIIGRILTFMVVW